VGKKWEMSEKNTLDKKGINLSKIDEKNKEGLMVNRQPAWSCTIYSVCNLLFSLFTFHFSLSRSAGKVFEITCN
jgi:hypothetical protein